MQNDRRHKPFSLVELEGLVYGKEEPQAHLHRHCRPNRELPVSVGDGLTDGYYKYVHPFFPALAFLLLTIDVLFPVPFPFFLAAVDGIWASSVSVGSPLQRDTHVRQLILT